MTKDLTPKDNAFFDFSVFFPEVEDQCRILVGCRWADYSASLIARAVEDCNARVLNIDVTSIVSKSYDMVVAIRANHRNPEAIVRSLTRYGYDVIDVATPSDTDTDKMRSRVNELLNYLKI